MERINSHPILSSPKESFNTFMYNGVPIKGIKGLTIAAALHQNGFPVHSHSIKGRKRSLNCGIGKCGACEMIVDGEVKRICVTLVDQVKEVYEIKENTFLLNQNNQEYSDNIQYAARSESEIYKTDVLIIGAGPAGLSCRETLNKIGINCIVIDSNDRIGGQFLMQTHAFFFFEKQKRFGGMRGFDIAQTLASEDNSGIFLNSTVIDVLEDKKIMAKNTITHKVFYVEASAMVVATGAVPFMPAFENDDLPGVYTAAVVQKMMNSEFTLLGKNVLTVGAGNIGYLTSYQLMQAGAKVKLILEAMESAGGFPVQANRIRRLSIPIYTSHLLLKAIPNKDGNGISGAVVCKCENFKAIKGTEKLIDGIDVINICTGLIPDNQLLEKGELLFGKRCYGIGDALRIGEGTTAVLRGKQAAYEIAQDLGIKYDYNDYLAVSKEYIESQQKPIKLKEQADIPTKERIDTKPFVRLQCLYGFACNPCSFACPHGAITKSSTSETPEIDYQKCTGCMQCISQCPGLAIFGYDKNNERLFLPVEYNVEEGKEVYLVNDNGKKVGEGIIEKIILKPTKTNVAKIRVSEYKIVGSLQKNSAENFFNITGFIVKNDYPKEVEFKPAEYKPIEFKPVEFKPVEYKPAEYKPAEECESYSYICHCEDVSIEELLDAIGDRKYISIDEVKHITRIGMGSCRGKRCIPRLRAKLKEKGIEIVGNSTPRAPLSTRFLFGEMLEPKENIYIISSGVKKKKTEVLIAGGGIGGSALFRYFSQASKKTVLVNSKRGASWRNIAGGRPAFSLPEIAEIAKENQKIFEEIQKEYNVNYRETRYITFAHNEDTYRDLERSCAWSNGRLVDKKDFTKEISPYFNRDQKTYFAAQISEHCWQATPGRVIDFIRAKACADGGELLEDTNLVEVHKQGDTYSVLLYTHEKGYVEYQCEHFVNALGTEAEKYACMLGMNTGLYSVKHQAIITHRLPMLGKNGDILDMLIDRRKSNGFSAVYGQQLGETGQIIACASPAIDAQCVIKDANEMKFNTKSFSEIISEVFCNWIPALNTVPIQAMWAGCYVEPKYIIDPDKGLFVGLQGHGFMLAQYLAKMYVEASIGKQVPQYMSKLKLTGEGISERSFK